MYSSIVRNPGADGNRDDVGLLLLAFLELPAYLSSGLLFALW